MIASQFACPILAQQHSPCVLMNLSFLREWATLSARTFVNKDTPNDPIWFRGAFFALSLPIKEKEIQV